MTLQHPFWLILLLPIAAFWLKWRFASRLLNTLRIIAIFLVILALCRPALKLESRTGVVVVVADRSRSMPVESSDLQKEAIRLLQSGMKKNDQMAVVSFGEKTAVETRLQKGDFAGFVHDVGDEQSNLAEAIETALALIPPGSPGKILLLSDGKWTGTDPARATAHAAARSVSIDFRLYQRALSHDIAISKLIAPETIYPGEAFLFKARIHSSTSQDVKYRLFRDKTVIASGTQTLSAGESVLMFRDTADTPGTHAYALQITGTEKDPIPENNQAKILVGVSAPRPILFVSPKKNSGLAKLLKKGGLHIQGVTPYESQWRLEYLSQFSALIFENLPADTISTSGMETIAAWVQETGAGLMMTGGMNAYGPGGYFRSPLDPILPVSMELRQEHRKLSLAIVVALDRSGSMAVGAGKGKAKMDLANIGAVQVLDLLSPIDEFGVLAVDSVAHTVLNLDSVEKVRSDRDKILSIDSGGGGIFVYQALLAAAKMLQNANAKTRHIILFADAADAEEPGKYKELIEECVKANITISVIGLGIPTDQDADLLRDIASRGNGRCFFTNLPWDIPRLFAQDTFTVVRSTFVEEVTQIKKLPALNIFSLQQTEQIPNIGGYNLCYLKPDATLSLMTQDEYHAPILASWHAKKGRVLCYTGEADGEFTGPIANWEQAGNFFTSMARWISGKQGELPDEMLMTQRLDKGILTIELELDPERKKEVLTTVPNVGILRGIPGKTPKSSSYPMQWKSPDILSVEIPIHGSETVLPTVEFPDMKNNITLSPSCLPYSPEFIPTDQDSGESALKAIAKATSGKERINLSGIWEDLPEKPQFMDIAHVLIIAALLIFLLEILHRRTGLLRIRRRKKVTQDKEPAVTKTPRKKFRLWKKKSISPSIPTPEKEPLSDTKSDEKSGALDAMRRAKDLAKKRMER